MKRNHRLEGVYDIQTLNFLLDEGIHEFSMDFRPRSFNYIQQYKFEELIENHWVKNQKYYLHFQNEQDFIIRKILDDLNKLMNKIGHGISEGHFYLEFSDNQEVEYYENFELPFIWHYDPLKDCDKILGAKNLAGLVIDYAMIEAHHMSGTLNDFVSRFYRQIDRRDLKFILSSDWNADIFPSIEEYFNFDVFSLPINSKVELAYRQVNCERIAQNIRQFQI